MKKEEIPIIVDRMQEVIDWYKEKYNRTFPYSIHFCDNYLAINRDGNYNTVEITNVLLSEETILFENDSRFVPIERVKEIIDEWEQ